MLAFEVEIDGKSWLLAGVEDWSLLTLFVTASRKEENSKGRDGYIEARAGGLTLPNDEQVRHHFRWLTAELEIGSCLTVRVVDSSSADIPKKRYRSDPAIHRVALHRRRNP